MNIKYAYSLALLLSLTSGYSCGMDKESALQIPENWSAIKETDKIKFVQDNGIDNTKVVHLLDQLNKNNKNKVSIYNSREIGDANGCPAVHAGPKSKTNPFITYAGPAIGFAAGMYMANTKLGQTITSMVGLSPVEGAFTVSAMGTVFGGLITGRKKEKEWYRAALWRIPTFVAMTKLARSDEFYKAAGYMPIFGPWLKEFGHDISARFIVAMALNAGLQLYSNAIEEKSSYLARGFGSKMPLINKWITPCANPSDFVPVTVYASLKGLKIINNTLNKNEKLEVTYTTHVPDAYIKVIDEEKKKPNK